MTSSPGARPIGDEAGVALVRVLSRARDLGFLGPGPIDDHVDHALRMAAAVGQEPRVKALDLGAGGGVPGLVLALAWPSSTWILLEASLRRVDYLRQAVQELRVESRVQVLRSRAEDAGRGALRHAFGLVVARSFGPPAVTAECAAPFLAAGGLLVVSEPPESTPADRWPADGLAQLGLELESDQADYGFARIRSRVACDPRFPRRVGVPGKRPLF